MADRVKTRIRGPEDCTSGPLMQYFSNFTPQMSVSTRLHFFYRRVIFLRAKSRRITFGSKIRVILQEALADEESPVEFTAAPSALLIAPGICRRQSPSRAERPHSTASKLRHTLNRSPSTVSSSSPFCNWVRLRAMLRPRPLPSVLRELSPRTKRSISSSALMSRA